ncbi:hypothetical protein CesoFtcFv8_013528 [Champsocephalus esox]|uniref:Uncharacterized protein n=2 Tax=Champsocephalus TaxID=52236 RepID=A0AAN8HLP9_CHAGU|nr:hypothetical protein CesoFtcFv8_013528 [Champsocephalus esox]KAK5920481.1 hypothetical protein CgunFtcFv8_024288 [Champsocephalus gunnari]
MEVPCGFRRHLLPPLPIYSPTPHNPEHPLCPPSQPVSVWQTGSPGSAGKWQPCVGPEGPVRVCLGGDHPSIHSPMGANPGIIMTPTEIQSAGRLGH